MRSRCTHTVPETPFPIGPDAYLCCASAGLEVLKNNLTDGEWRPRTVRRLYIRFGNALKSTPEDRRSDDRPGDGDGDDDGGAHTAAGHYDLMLFTPSGLPQCTLEIGSDRYQRFLIARYRYAFG
jgi:hypothetical protein